MKSGSRQQEPSPQYPEDCVQHYLASWWTEVGGDDGNMKRGQLLTASVPYFSHEPLALVPTDRVEATEHDRIAIQLRRPSLEIPIEQSRLPIAALPLYNKETLRVYKCKRRPVLVLATEGEQIDSQLAWAKWQTSRHLIVAPYYGIQQKRNRKGWHPKLIGNIKKMHVSRLFWDMLPGRSRVTEGESILRLDHMHPINEDFKRTSFRLSEDAMKIVDECLRLYYTGVFDSEGLLGLICEELEEIQNLI